MNDLVTRVIVPTGMLGGGVVAEQIAYGIARGAHAIACDSGSTDSGPSYLARGVSKVNREAIRRDLEVLLGASKSAGIPLIIGSCGTAGTDSGVNWTFGIVKEICRALDFDPPIALLYSEQNAELLKIKNAEGAIRPLSPSGMLDDQTLDSCVHIVALMGPEPYVEALRGGAQILLGGRTTDTAVIAAVPLLRGAPLGLAWHAGKVAECGGQCTTNPRKGGVLVSIDQDGFDVEPLDEGNQCTPQTVSAHLLYENTDPIRLIEPGGILDTAQSCYEALDFRITRVTGSRWDPHAYTMKLEGAAAGGFQTIMLIGIEDPDVLANLDLFHDRLLDTLRKRVEAMFALSAREFDISLRIYGWNGVSGRAVPPNSPPPREVGVMFVATAATQVLATSIAKACNPYFFHFPIDSASDLPSYAFPFTPAEIERGQVFEFKLNHVVATSNGLELVRIRIGCGADLTGAA